VWGTAITQVFAVGTLSRIERYNGSSWSEITGLLPGTWRVEGIHGNGNIMVAGSFYGVIRFDGTSWNQIAAPPGGIGVFRVFPGGDIYNVKIGRLQRWTGSEWVEVGCPCSTIGTVPAAVAARAPDEIYAFVNAAGPTVQVHRWDGTAWRMIQTFSGRVSAAAWAGNQGIAVGDDGLVLRATTNSAIQ
jgi:hypothetical protein